MKELSIEEKAKAYDEKLDVARHIYADPSVKDEDKYYIEVIFHELAESEDERIINNIKKVIGWYRGMFTEKSLMPEQYQEIDAWLEKQGETFTKKDVDDAYLKGICDAKQELEKQGEQKPVELEEPNFFDDFRHSDCEQKSAWSEKDEEIHRKCICAMRASACGFPEEEKFVEQVDNWLKSLKDRYVSQPKREWSEEDEKNVADYLYCLNVGFTQVAARQRAKDICNLLRPQNHWKPSEEQMKALNTCIMQGEISYVGQGTELQSLYNDLKKLTE